MDSGQEAWGRRSSGWGDVDESKGHLGMYHVMGMCHVMGMYHVMHITYSFKKRKSKGHMIVLIYR